MPGFIELWGKTYRKSLKGFSKQTLSKKTNRKVLKGQGLKAQRTSKEPDCRNARSVSLTRLKIFLNTLNYQVTAGMEGIMLRICLIPHSGYRNRILIIPYEAITQIRAAPTEVPGWFETELSQAWKHLFLITPVSVQIGDLPLDHPEWNLTPNQWWKFLTDLPEISWEKVKAINRAPLGRVRVAYSRKEASGLQRDGHGSLVKSPNSETDPNYGSGAEMRYAFELQRGHPRHPETHDNLEARLGGIQSPIKEDRVEYGESGSNEY